MIVVKDISEMRSLRWSKPLEGWGLVPTMGFLHQGHLSLIRRARQENDRVVVSIFINPTQFGPSEDLASYPRDLERDLTILEIENVDIVFFPGESTMYPAGFQTKVIVDNVTKPLEGITRPTHFQGVSTIVAKLLNICQPTRAYFGQKDAQQVIVIRQMVEDLNFNLQIVVCPIIREQDGLALSSRNVRLTSNQREAATVLFRSLTESKNRLEAGERNSVVLREFMTSVVNAEALASLDYVSAADPATLEELDTIENEVLLSLAVYFGEIRLIDNTLWKRQ
jgi:pantoate--beta-alanine ligase